MDNNKRRPTGLIQNNKIEPKQTAENTIKPTIDIPIKRKQKKEVAKNQEANIKTSTQTKKELDILMTLTDNKFSYEMLETLIDYYVETALDSDKRRAFKTLSSLWPKKNLLQITGIIKMI